MPFITTCENHGDGLSGDTGISVVCIGGYVYNHLPSQWTIRAVSA